MKFKYFLRGLGTGIIFTSIICLVAFQNAEVGNISDKEVIERAKELGLVENKESVKDTFASEKAKDDKTVSEKQTKGTEVTEAQSSEASVPKTELTEKQTTEKNTTEKQTEEKQTEEKQTEEKTTEEKITEKSTVEKGTTEQATTENITENKTVTITIKGGSTSYPVCQKLQELGVIQDATDFDNYLIKNGYANRIRVGTHTLTIGMSYEEIAIAISDPR